MGHKGVAKGLALSVPSLIFLAGLRVGPSAESLAFEGPARDDPRVADGPAERLKGLRAWKAQQADLAGRQINSILFSMLTESRRTVGESIGLSEEQRRQVGQLHTLLRDSQKASVRREVEYLDSLKGPTDALMRRVGREIEQNEARRKEAVASAENFLLVGLLEAPRADLLKRFRWRSQDFQSLQDAELANRLRLTREQRRLISVRIADRLQFFRTAPSIPKMSELADQAYKDLKERQKALEGEIWKSFPPNNTRSGKG